MSTLLSGTPASQAALQHVQAEALKAATAPRTKSAAPETYAALPDAILTKEYLLKFARQNPAYYAAARIHSPALQALPEAIKSFRELQEHARAPRSVKIEDEPIGEGFALGAIAGLTGTSLGLLGGLASLLWAPAAGVGFGLGMTANLFLNWFYATNDQGRYGESQVTKYSAIAAAAGITVSTALAAFAAPNAGSLMGGFGWAFGAYLAAFALPIAGSAVLNQWPRLAAWLDQKSAKKTEAEALAAVTGDSVMTFLRENPAAIKSFLDDVVSGELAAMSGQINAKIKELRARIEQLKTDAKDPSLDLLDAPLKQSTLARIVAKQNELEEEIGKLATGSLARLESLSGKIPEWKRQVDEYLTWEAQLQRLNEINARLGDAEAAAREAQSLREQMDERRNALMGGMVTVLTDTDAAQKAYKEVAVSVAS